LSGICAKDFTIPISLRAYFLPVTTTSREEEKIVFSQKKAAFSSFN
jgi:hypothetical protein